LKGLELDHHFDAVMGSDAGFPKKPDPAIVHHLLERFSLSRENTVLIGDSRIDVETGKNAGILTCGFLGGLRPPEEVREAEPDFVISNLLELKELFS
jgi:phosphoglycolate phosphatase-like HAD superfamily hydrolase